MGLIQVKPYWLDKGYDEKEWKLKVAETKRKAREQKQKYLFLLSRAKHTWFETTYREATVREVKSLFPGICFNADKPDDWYRVTQLYRDRCKSYEIEAKKQLPPPVLVTERKPLPPPILVPQRKFFPEDASKQVCLPSTPKTLAEQEVSIRLAAVLKGVREVANNAGRVDVLTKEYVIEVKTASDWKHGIGQVLVYSLYYPNKKPVLLLFGEDIEIYRSIAQEHCARLNILYKEEIEFNGYNN
ncbi:hypothetical protein F7734_52140 [Scytonema sp. UIC 10036]|uniref:hypothetical protein n=1 Tax=Scytonema sp. UIC 10036 TaxID=2304196 RepID=UPI0012DA7F5F|nr:hypothetical protein [Scytonema sp. UIC 10036]MUH00374.1 hypothetical protein [Scytonema sp. UIC 10036]